MPGNAFGRPLELVHRTPAEQHPVLRGRGQSEPPDIAGFHRGFGAFHLEASDDTGRRVTKFDTPLTLTIRFTPQQLQALGLSADTLRIFWFDEDQVVDRGKGGVVKGLWVPQTTIVDAEAGTASLQVDHFSAFQLGDGSSPSAAYLPSLQGWQVSGFTGAASFSFPFDLPAGPGGLKPSLSLSYSSAASDGAGGMRTNAQASWVGKGWSLDTGAVMLNKVQLTSYSSVNYHALAFGGRSYTLMRAESLPGISNPDPNDPTHWAWRPTDESYIRVRVIKSADSAPGSAGSPGRGASDYGAPLPRYIWQVWTQDGTRYDFAEDGWWLWAKCSGEGAFAYAENNRWLLSSITDVSGNTINYSYGRSSAYYDTCMQQSATVDFDIWPTEITWAGGRYRVQFHSVARSFDTQADWPEYTIGGPARETRQLVAIQVWSYPDGSSYPNGTPQLVRQYNLGYKAEGESVLGDGWICTSQPCTSWGPASGNRKLTLYSLQRIGSDGATALPPLTFAYHASPGSALYPAGGWNRLSRMDNNQGGAVTLSYDLIAQAVGNDLFKNRHRVTTRTESDGRGTSSTWSYSYEAPRVNALGTTLDPGLENGLQTGSTPSSAALYYNVFLDGSLDRDQEAQLPQPSWSEFRGHSAVTETDPSGARTRRTFIQGDAGCVPGAGARGEHNAIVSDGCFQELLRQEFLKGRESRSEQLTSGNVRLAESVRSFGVGEVQYGVAPLSGLWRAFSYESAVEERVSEGGAATTTRRTEYIYSGSYGPNLSLMCDPSAGLSSYGTLSCVREYDRGTLVRQTAYGYNAPLDTPTRYLVGLQTGITVMDASLRILAQTLRFYDENITAAGSVGARGLLTRELAFEVPLQTLSGIAGQWLNARDTTYAYDSWGNRITVSSYDGWGRGLWGGSGWQIGPPGDNSIARTTTTGYDTVFNSFPTSVTNALGHQEWAGYDYRMGTLTSVTDINSQTTTASYDLFGRLSSLVRPGDSPQMPTVWASYDNWAFPMRYLVGLRETAGSPANRPVSRFYDGLGRLIQEKAESQDGTQNIVTDYRYDGLGRLSRQSEPRYVNELGEQFARFTSVAETSLLWTETSFDALGRVSSVTTPDGGVTTHRYFIEDALRLHDVTDANRHRTQTGSDTLGRLVRVHEYRGDCGLWYSCSGTTTTPYSLASQTLYSYTPLDLLSQVTEAPGNITSLSYDSLGRKRSMSDPDMGSWSYSYDANDNLFTQIDAKGQSTQFQYDRLGRLTARLVGTLAHYYTYDDTFGAGARGQLTRTQVYESGSPKNAVYWFYDARGRVSARTVDVMGIGSRTLSYSYDSADRVSSITYPHGEVISYSYDPAWRQTSACSSGTALSGCYATGVSYDARNQQTFVRRGN